MDGRLQQEDLNDRCGLIIETAQEGIWIVDERLRTTFVNRSMEKMLGYLADELFGTRLDEFVVSEDLSSAGRLLQQGCADPLTIRYLNHQGEILWTSTSSCQITDNQGAPQGFLVMVMDITLRQKGLEAAIESEAKFRSFFENSMDGFLITVPHRGIIAANPAACALFQLSEEELCQLSIPAIFSYAEPKLALLFEERNKTGKAKGEVLFKQRSGKIIPGEVTTVLFKDAMGNEQSSIIIRDISDLTQRKLAEKTLRQSQANLLTIFNNTDIAYALIDASLKVVSFNGRAAELAALQGYKTAAEGQYVLDYFDPERHSMLLGMVDRVLKGEKIEYQVSRNEPNGDQRWYDLKWIPIGDEGYSNWGFLLSVEDVTITRNAAMEREKLYAELVKRNEDLEQFTYVLSHNLRAPVANIIGLITLIKDNLDPSLNLELINGLEVSAVKLDEVITDLNHVLKVGRGVNVETCRINFTQLMQDIEVSISQLIASEQATITCNFSQCNEVNGVRSYFHSIFYNLIINSIRYKRPGVNPEIEIHSEHTEDGVKLVFRDNGRGIDLPKHGKELFGLYKRISAEVEGKGMGLYLVKTQVEAMHGVISVESERDEGTTFTIAFPV